jgi:hypothetical protein
MKDSHPSLFIVSLMTKTATFCALLSISLPVRAAQWFEEMQFGPAWSNTFVDQYKGQRRAAALKGILVDLGERKNCAVYDTETLRWVTAYSGFVKWGGTPWTGQHGNLVTLQDEKPVFITESVCGWAAESGSFDDDRELKGMGNLPAKHGRYLGYYKNGQAIVIESEVQGTRVLELAKSGASGIERHWEIAPSSKDLLVLLADEEAVARAAALDLAAAGAGPLSLLDGGFAAWQAAGLPVESTPELPSNANCIDYLFFVHDRHEGNREAAMQYLAWETHLIEQLDAQELAGFRVSAG